MRNTKFGNVRHGRYASRHEAQVAADLQALEKAGKIHYLQMQKRFLLIPGQKGKLRNERPLSYIADFVYRDERDWHVCDAKGFKPYEYLIKRKLMKFIHNIEIEEL